MQLPVMSGAPAKVVAVTIFPVKVTCVSDITSPEIVVRLGLADIEVEEVALGKPVEPVAAGEEERLMLASALDSPAGEHPTKSGAVSLTAAHSSLLNWIAARKCQKSSPLSVCSYILACSAVLQAVDRQHDNAATYDELEQRHAMSITEHDFWAEVEFERHCCCSKISSGSS